MKLLFAVVSFLYFCSSVSGQSLRKKIKQHIKDDEFKYIEAYNKFEDSFSDVNKEILNTTGKLINDIYDRSNEVFERIGDRKIRLDFQRFNALVIGNLTYFQNTLEDRFDIKEIRKDFKSGFLITDTLYVRLTLEDYACLKAYGDDIKNFSSFHYMESSKCLVIPLKRIEYFRRLSLSYIKQISDGLMNIFQKLGNCRKLKGNGSNSCISNIFWNAIHKWIQPIFRGSNTIPHEFTRLMEVPFTCIYNFLTQNFIANYYELESKLNTC